MEHIELSKLYLKVDDNGNYYFKAVYIRTNDYGKYRITIPHINLNIPIDRLPDRNLCYHQFGDKLIRFIDGPEQTMNNDMVVVSQKDKDGWSHKSVDCCWVEETLEEYAKELTIEEIEEKLGYKIKVVGGTDNA